MVMGDGAVFMEKSDVEYDDHLVRLSSRGVFHLDSRAVGERGGRGRQGGRGLVVDRHA